MVLNAVVIYRGNVVIYSSILTLENVATAVNYLDICITRCNNKSGLFDRSALAKFFFNIG
jgi:hypothetical protein